MQDWMPRTPYEQAHVDRIIKFQSTIPTDTDYADASKQVQAELDKWQRKDGFWFAEENRQEKVSHSHTEQVESWVLNLAPAVVVIGTPLLTWAVGSTAGFGSGVLTFFIFPVVAIIGSIVIIKQAQKPRDELEAELQRRRALKGIRNDFTVKQKKHFETLAKQHLKYVALANFDARVKDATKDQRDRQKRLARQKGIFATQNKPPKAPYGVSDKGAEALVAQWMIWLGVFDAKATKYVGDGGIDAEGTGFIAQVKNFNGFVGVKDIRELKGVAAVDGRNPLFFTSGEYSKGCKEFAEEAGVYLFEYDAERGTLRHKNTLAKQAMEKGLSAFDTPEREQREEEK